MKVTVLFSDPWHPAYPHIKKWCKDNDYFLVNFKGELVGGEYLFLISCTEIMPPEIRNKYERVLVLHESDLPKGRGWSPLAWQIVEGKNEIVVSLIEAADPVDTGNVIVECTVRFKGHELHEDIHEQIASAKITLIEAFINCPLNGIQQAGEPTYYRQRTAEDSRIDPGKSIAEQFDLLRICDPRFPAFFDHRGHRYTLTIQHETR